MSHIFYQLKQAWMSLKKNPGFCLSIISTMSITLGLLLCLLNLNLLMFVEPLPYPEQDRLFVAELSVTNKKDQNQSSGFNYDSLMTLHKKQLNFDKAAIGYYSWSLIVDHPEQPFIVGPFHLITVYLLTD